ncbi:hypothetical protein OE88DRAFT_1656561 [Heliocybe sulcata]|uniref:DNA helicase Pif1-like 2B domain-containing protein n=1 Tax=Heliocybe sulcata TaxID=5364 RepID=A0A5C3N519_9AGAM|nr:hypothetical protein OE88DRAFT_1656561 [Heliocybe sulcata]
MHPEFVDLLNSMRVGITTPDALTTFRSLSRPLPPSSILPTELFPLRHEVDSANSNRLKSLAGPIHTFDSRDSGSAPPDTRNKLLKNMMAVEKLEVKAGAQVMLIKNVDNGVEGGLVNGSVGVLRGFHRIGEVQSELVGGEARTGGAAEKNGHVRSVRVDGDGKPVVVVKSEEGKENKGCKDEKPKSEVKGKAEKPQSNVKGKAKKEEKDEEMYPLVEFVTPAGKEMVLLVRDEFRVEDGDGNVLARRMQVRISFTDSTRLVVVLTCVVGSIDPRMGNVDPQEPRADDTEGEGGPRQGFRERSKLRGPLQGSFPRRSAGSSFRP